jgi:glyoxylase-like metal-dependent hydrolase (beta-lactamase superfamily II)
MPEEIADGVYDVTVSEDGGRYRCYLCTRDTPVLFDTGLDGTTDVLLDGLAEIGVTPEHVVVTHGDPDHVGGLPAVRAELDATTWVPRETDLADDSLADRRYADGDRIGPYRAVHVPGHEPDNYVLVDEDGGVAVMGDAVVGADQRGLPAGYFHLPPAVHSVDLNEAEENLERVLAYEFDVGLVFHGSPVLSDASAKLERYVEFVGKP